jgi:preprotein translocase, secE subunit
MSSLVEFIKGSYDEFKNKVEWSKWSDLQSSTLVVSVATVLLALFTFGVDSVFRRAISNVLGMLIKLFNQ